MPRINQRGAAAELTRLRYRYLRDRLGEYHPATLEAILEVARDLAATPGARDEAVDTYVALARRLWVEAGPDDPWYLEIVQEAGEVVYLTGQVRRAESMFQEVLAARRRVLGPNHPDTQVTARSLNRVLGRG
jgi:eukaryotic-like serine/threonine-protein kinase